MLTEPLVRARVRKGVVEPRFVELDRGPARDWAEQVIALFQDAVADRSTLGELTEQLREIEGDSPDHQLVRGLAKLLQDRCTFGVDSEVDPVELRAEVFSLAATRGPLSLRPGPSALPVADDVLAEVGARRGLDVETVREALYGDLKSAQRLLSFSRFDLHGPGAAGALLHRYNTALVQAILARATQLTVLLVQPQAKRVRQLMRYVKFFQLMHRARLLRGAHDGKDALEIVLDGPQSLLRQSTRYGRQLATFLPALLLQQGPWALEAEVMWGRGRRVPRRLHLTHTAGLRSHYQDRGTWESLAEQRFRERFVELDSGWSLHEGELVGLGGQRVLVPDLCFRRGGRVAYLDIVGFWRKGYLTQRVAETPAHVVLAVSKRLAGDKAGIPAALRERVVPFAEIINAREVLRRVEAVAVEERAPAVR